MSYLLDADWIIQAAKGQPDFLSPFRFLDLNDGIARHFGELRALLRRRGEMISEFDVVVAATALHHDLTVLTFNVRHFQRIPDLKLYQPR